MQSRRDQRTTRTTHLDTWTPRSAFQCLGRARSSRMTWSCRVLPMRARMIRQRRHVAVVATLLPERYHQHGDGDGNEEERRRRRRNSPQKCSWGADLRVHHTGAHLWGNGVWYRTHRRPVGNRRTKQTDDGVRSRVRISSLPTRSTIPTHDHSRYLCHPACRERVSFARG